MHGTSARLLHLLALLQARAYWTGGELAGRLEVTTRTVRRDVDRLRALGYPVKSGAGVAGGYQLGAGATLPPLLLDDDEALAVSLGLRTAAAGTVSGVEEAALRALGKLERMLPQRLRNRVQAMHRAVASLYMPHPQVDAAILMDLASACRDGRRASFHYEDKHGTPSLREVEPHGLVHTGSRWYLVAWDTQRADWRTFRVDRVEGEISDGPCFTPRQVPGGDTAAFVSRALSSGPYTLQAHVVFHAPLERVAKRAPTLAGHLRRVSKNRCVLKLGGHALDTLALHIAAIGEEFEVKQPPELEAHIRELAARLSRAGARSKRRRAARARGSR